MVPLHWQHRMEDAHSISRIQISSSSSTAQIGTIHTTEQQQHWCKVYLVDAASAAWHNMNEMPRKA